DVITGAMFTGPQIDFTLMGPLWLRFTRSYTTSAVRRRTALGWGWSCCLDWTVRREGGRLTLIDDEGRETQLRFPDGDETSVLSYGRKLSQREGDLLVDAGTGSPRSCGSTSSGSTASPSCASGRATRSRSTGSRARWSRSPTRSAGARSAPWRGHGPTG